MSRLLAASALAAGAFLLLANGREVPSPNNHTSFSVHQPVVSRTDYVLDLTGDGYRLAPGEGDRLAGWLNALQLGYGDRVSVDGGGARDEVASIVADYGLLLSRSAPVTVGAIPPGASRVIVSRASAEVTGCPDWSVPASPTWAESTMSDHGCATSTNLAAMIANPEDLVHGQTGNPVGGDAATVSKAIQVYRDAAPTGKNGLPGGITSVSVVKTGGQ